MYCTVEAKKFDSKLYPLLRDRNLALQNHQDFIANEIDKLSEAICLYRKLRNLDSFHIELLPANFLRRRLMGRVRKTPGDTSAAALWDIADCDYRGRFYQLRETVLKRTFKGFKVKVSVREEQGAYRVGWTQYPWPKSLHLAFRKE